MNAIIEKSGLQPETAAFIEGKFADISKQLSEWQSKATGFVVRDISQKDEMKQAREARLLIVNIRTSADKVREELKKDSLKFGNTVQSIYNDIEKQCKAIESHLKLQEDFEKNLIAAQIETLRVARESKISAYREFTIVGQNLGTLTDADFDKLFEGAKLQYEAKIAKEKEVEIKKIEFEKLVKQRQDRELVLLQIQGVKRNPNNTFTLECLDFKDASHLIDVKEILDCEESVFASFLQEFKSTEKSNGDFLEKERIEYEKLKVLLAIELADKNRLKKEKKEIEDKASAERELAAMNLINANKEQKQLLEKLTVLETQKNIKVGFVNGDGEIENIANSFDTFISIPKKDLQELIYKLEECHFESLTCGRLNENQAFIKLKEYAEIE